jgi:hypothetical protein
MKPGRFIQGAFFASLVSAFGCGGAAVPNDHVASSEAALRAATELGAEKVPRAALELTLAKEQIAKAKALIGNGENEKADILLQRAQADAELALALARESQAQADAQQTIDEVQRLQAKTK